MKSFFRENPTIAFGLGLPLLLVVVFLLISGIPTVLVAPPQYDVLYATEYYNQQNAVQISVVNKKVQVIYQDGRQANLKPHLWRYYPKTGAVQEITIILPPRLAQADNKIQAPEKASETILVNVTELENLSVDSSSIAPDGYEFSVEGGLNSGGLFSGLFYSPYAYRNETVLTKKGRRIRLPHLVGQYYDNNIHFIGWVVTP